MLSSFRALCAVVKHKLPIPVEWRPKMSHEELKFAEEHVTFPNSVSIRHLLQEKDDTELVRHFS